MNNFLIISNKQKDEKLLLAEHVKTLLNNKGAFCRIYDAGQEPTRGPIDVPAETECILVIGGDGTILDTAGRLIGKNIPLLGINRGTLGFLADVDIHSLDDTIDDLMADRFQIEKRIMLEAEIIRKGEEPIVCAALNDCVILRCSTTPIIGLAVRINGILIDQYHADGVIICTPTGSTGYNLSAGGPIINPTCKNFVVTPICPHSLTTRSVVLAKDDVVTIELENLRNSQNEDALVSIDGKDGILIGPGDQVRIRKAQEETPFIKTKEISFVTILKEKLL